MGGGRGGGKGWVDPLISNWFMMEAVGVGKRNYICREPGERMSVQGLLRKCTHRL